jgi:hypothetical protein
LKIKAESAKEVISMLNFDLMDTVAGKEIFEEGMLKEARDMVIEALTERFVAVPENVAEAVYAGRRDVLKELHRHAIRIAHNQMNLTRYFQRLCLFQDRETQHET